MKWVTYKQWSNGFGIRGLIDRRPYIEYAEDFLEKAGQFFTSSIICIEGAKSIERIALALTRGLYKVMTDEEDEGDVESHWYVGELHSRMRLLAVVMGLTFRRTRSWQFPTSGMLPVLLRGADAARERLVAYDPAVMSKATTTDVLQDLQLILENIRWEALGSVPAADLLANIGVSQIQAGLAKRGIMRSRSGNWGAQGAFRSGG